MTPDRKQIEEAVEICKEKNWGKVELNVTDEQFKEYLRTFLSLAQLFLEVEKGMPKKKHTDFRSGDNYDAAFNNGFNSAIDLCTAHWARKVEGAEDVIENILREKIKNIGEKDQTYIGYPIELIKDLTQAIRQHLLGGGK